MSCIRIFLESTIQRMTSGCKKRKPPKLSSIFDAPAATTSSFAAMEVSNQFKQVFEVMDANGDGKISPLELSVMLSCLGYKKSIATKEAEGIVREMDFNGDGFIDLDEFMTAVNVDRSRNNSKMLGLGMRKKSELMDAFRIFDADKNGKISAEELQKVLVSLGCQKCSLKECRKMIKGVDRNGDGAVDFEEFRLMMTRNYVS
ncbi:calcium-binding protein CML23 [Pyrus ussuriensis x Pyrus communis]|uniref:Calcium-binding protein CML23 n=1 Tax=Pyrus ussuriensis x Pyrus communis TaxID=2448454 RepID=A0A5N5EYF0_9ROSA|nr:calcium-binding protein CML23 [Pyrus ussuriensis x Pyrus communis]